MLIYKLVIFNSFHPFAIQPHHIQCASFSDVYSVNAHESIRHGLTAVGGPGVAHAVCHHINAHAAFQANAVAVFAVHDLFCWKIARLLPNSFLPTNLTEIGVNYLPTRKA